MTNQTANNSKENDHLQIESDVNLDFSNPIITSSNNSSNNGDVCRDYLRNTCRRGQNCKFNHPEQNDPKKGDIPLFTFCHDFQNWECKRNNCKFVHCSKQEEELYNKTGKLPSSVNYNLNGSTTSANQTNQNSNQNHNNQNHGKFKRSLNNNNNNGNNYSVQKSNNFKDQDIPICKDYIKNDCFRGSRCKFRHVKNDSERNFNANDNKNSGYESATFDKQFTGSNMNTNSASLDTNTFMMQQRFDQLNQLKTNSIQNHPLNRTDQFQIPIDRRNNIRNLYEPEPKRRAFDNGYSAPTTFANNNPNNQLCVTNALNQLHHQNHSNQTTGSTDLATNSAASLAAAVAINEFNNSNVSNAATSNTITRSMYSNLNDNRFLIEENNSLRHKIDELKQQVVDLMNANEFLLEQNAKLRNTLLPTTSVNQNVNQVTTTLHNNPVSGLHTNVVQPKPTNNPAMPVSSQSQLHIGATTITTNQTAADLLVANHLHRQNQQRAVVASATSSVALSNCISTNPLSAASSISSLTSTSASTPLVSYPIMTASLPASIHSLGHLTH